MFDEKSNLTFVAGGILVALLLIVLVYRQSAEPTANLRREFQAQAPGTGINLPDVALPRLNLPDLSPALGAQIGDLYRQFGSGGSVPALTPVASGSRVRIEIVAAQRTGGDVLVRGNLRNIGSDPITVPAGAFSFRDSTGTNYTVSGSGGSQITPGQSTTFELSVPVPADRGITLVFSLPPDTPVEQIVVAQPGG